MSAAPATSTFQHATAARPRLSGHIPALDGVRGVAILLVLLYHFAAEAQRRVGIVSPLSRPWRDGWIGVDLFFVLSGFLITGILYESRASKHYFRNFYMRRALRIFPLYFGTLAAVFVAAWISPEASRWLGQTRDQQAWYWFYGANILDAMQGWSGPLSHFWSLCVEEHFYLIWPLLILLLTRRQVMATCGAAVVLAIVSRALLSRLPHGEVASYALTPARIDSLAIGGMLALAFRGDVTAERAGRWAGWALVVGLGSFVALYVAYRLKHHNVMIMRLGGYTCGAVFFAGVLGRAVLARGLPARLWANPMLRTMGKYSYALYVLHPLLEPLRVWAFVSLGLTALRRWPNLAFIVYVCFALVLSTVAAMASWHLLEKHFLKLKRLFPERPVARPAPPTRAVQQEPAPV